MKLGCHVLAPTPASFRWSAHCNVVKSVAGTAPLQAAPAHALRIYRWPFDEVEQTNLLLSQDAGELVAKILNGLGGYRHPRLHVELLNEVHRDATSAHIALAAKAIPLLHAAGVKVAVPSWSTGGFEQEHWDLWRVTRWAGGDLIALHAYWGDQGLTQDHALRWRQFWKPGDPPVAVVEAGRDRVEGGKGGWKADGLTDEQYLSELIAFDEEISHDEYVVGATLFSCGAIGQFEAWRDFEADPLADSFAARYMPWSPSHPAPVDVPKPAIHQEPTPPIAPSQETPMAADVVLSVPSRATHAVEGNWGRGEVFGPSVGVLIHSTAGQSSTIENDFVATVNWFTSAEAGVSAQRVIGGGRLSEVCTCVGDYEVAFHGRDPDNHHRHSIELAHPDTPTSAQTPYPDFQYEAAGELIARWRLADAAKGWAWPIKLLSRAELAANPMAKGICFHRDTPAGVADGKRDPTPQFDPSKLMLAASRWYATLAGGSAVPPTPTPPTDATALRDQTYGLADQLQKLSAGWTAAGYPHLAAYVASQGEAIKETVNVSKGQR